jgi:hypothetical protein
MEHATEVTLHHDRSVCGTLAISFSGPFFYIFQAGHINTSVDIYAPYCPYHEAGFFYSRASVSETDLWKCALSKQHGETLTGAARTYCIKGDGIRVNTNKPQIISPVYPEDRASKDVKIIGVGDGTPFAPRLDKMMFRLSVPRPKYVYPLYADLLEVVPDYNTVPSNKYDDYCTGLRFFYEWNADEPIFLEIPSGDSVDVTPPVFCHLPLMAEIELRYAGMGLADEIDAHSDARSCFASLAILAGVERWLNYGDGLGSPTNPGHASSPDGTAPDPCGTLRPRFHTGADCDAPIMAMGLDAPSKDN